VGDFGDRGGWWVVAQGVLFLLTASALWAAGSEPPAGWLAVGLAITVAGLAFSFDALVRIRRFVTAMPAPVDGAPLVQTGSFGLVRHPIYGGLVIATVGLAVARASWVGGVASAALLAFFSMKSRQEERMLEAAYPDYAAYRDRVTRRLIPLLY